MYKKLLTALLVSAMAIGTLAGCGNAKNNAESKSNDAPKVTDEKKDPEKTDEKKDDSKNEAAKGEQVLVWNLGSDPKTIDPGLNSAVDGGDIINNTFEGLMREVDGKLVPGMAESHEISDDLKTYTFKLRDAKWSDGKPVTAKDFEFAWKRVMDPKTASEYAFIMMCIKGADEFNAGTGSADDVGVKAVNDKTLEVSLKGPTDYFLSLTQFFSFMPVREDIVDNEGVWAKDPAKAVVNGPFKVAEYVNADKIVLVKNENYWKADEIKLDKIIAKMIVEESTAFTGYQSGEFDIIDDVPVQEIPRLMAEDPTFQLLPRIGTYYYNFNLNEEMFKDIKVRRAFTLAINRKSIVENITKAGELPAAGFVCPGLMDAEGNQFQQKAGDYGIPAEGDVETAKKLLAEAGYPNGEGFPTITLKYNTNESHKIIAEAVQEMLKKNLGVNVELENSEWAVFQDMRKNGDFQFSRGGWLGDYADPMTMLEIHVIDEPHNYSDWKSEEYTKLIEESRTTTGQERMNKFYEAEKILMEELPVMPIYYYTDTLMVNDKVKGWQKTLMGSFYFGKTYLEQ